MGPPHMKTQCSHDGFGKRCARFLNTSPLYMAQFFRQSKLARKHDLRAEAILQGFKTKMEVGGGTAFHKEMQQRAAHAKIQRRLRSPPTQTKSSGNVLQLAWKVPDPSRPMRLTNRGDLRSLRKHFARRTVPESASRRAKRKKTQETRKTARWTSCAVLL